MATSPVYPTYSAPPPNTYDTSSTGKFGLNAIQSLADNESIKLGNEAYQRAMVNYNTAVANWKANGSKGAPPTPPDPNQIYQAASTGSMGAGQTPWSLSPAQAAALKPASPTSANPQAAVTANRRTGTSPFPSVNAGSPTSPAPQASLPGTAVPTPGSPSRVIDSPVLNSAPTATSANPAVSGALPTYNPNAPTTPPNTGYVAPFGSNGQSLADQINDSQGLTKQIVSSYDTAQGRGNTMQDQFKSYADQNANRTAALQNTLAQAYAPAAAGSGGYTPDQIAAIEGQAGLDALPTSAANLQKNFITPEEASQIAWTPQNTQDLLDQAARGIQAGTQAQNDAIDKAAAAAGVYNPLAVTAMKNRASQSGAAAAADAQTDARIAAGQQQRQQALTLATNRQGVQQQNNNTQYSQGMDINQLESGRAQKVADTNVAAGQEYRNNYLQGQEQQSNANTQAGQQQQLNAFTSTNSGTNQANQVGVTNQNTPTTAQRFLFARGGVSAEGTPENPLQGPTRALVGEEYKPEAIVPIGPPYRAMADGSVTDPYQYPVDYNDPLAGAGRTPPAQKRSAWAEPSTYRNILGLAASSLFPRFSAFGPLISGGSTNPAQPDKPAWQKAAEASAATLGKGNRFTDSTGTPQPSDANLADRAAGASNFDEIMKYQPPGELAPMLFAAGASRPASRPSVSLPRPARTNPNSSPSTGHERPTPTTPTWNPNVGQQHFPPADPSIPNVTSTFPSTSPTSPAPSAPVPPGQVNTSISYPGIGVPSTPLPGGTVGSPAAGGSNSGITGPEGYPLPGSAGPDQTTIDYGGSGTPGEANPPGYGDYGGMFPSTPEPPAPVIGTPSTPTSGNIWDPSPIAPPPNYQPGIGEGGGDGVYLDPGVIPGGYGAVGTDPSELYPWFGDDNGLPSGNARGAVYAPPQTQFGPTRVVDKPTLLTLGARQPEAVVPLTKKKNAKVRPHDIPNLVKRYGE